MLSITPRELLQFRQVASKVWGRGHRRIPVTISGNESGVRLSQADPATTLVYRNTEPQPTASAFAVSAHDLQSFEGATDEPIEFRVDSAAASASVVSGWDMSSHIDIEPAACLDDEPAGTTVRSLTVDANVMEQLAQCASMADHNSSRAALQCIQLDGTTNAITGTDGRKALRITGSKWPWDDDRLIPACSWFGSSVVCRMAREVTIDNLGDSVRWTAGRWSIELPFESGRYPDVARVIPARSQADTIIKLSDHDHDAIRRFLGAVTKTARSSPSAVTFEATTQCVLRVAESDGSRVAELRLPDATRTGLPVSSALPLHALKSVVQLRFRQLLATERAQRFWCQEGEQSFAFMPLHPDFVVPAEVMKSVAC